MNVVTWCGADIMWKFCGNFFLLNSRYAAIVLVVSYLGGYRPCGG